MKKFLLLLLLFFSISIQIDASGKNIAVNNSSNFYNIYIQNTFGIENDFFKIEGVTPIFDNLKNTATICDGNTFIFDATISNYTLSDDRYVWNVNGVTGPKLNIGDPGTYDVTITLPDNTQVVESVTLIVHIITVLLPSDIQECATNSFDIISNVNLSGGITDSDVSYQWYLNGGSITGATSKDYTATKPGGNYTLKVISNLIYDGGACEKEASVNVTFPNPPNVDLGDDFELCSGDPINLSISGVTEDITWFYNGSVISGESSSTLNIPNTTTANSGTYRVEVLANGGCAFSDEVKITVLERPDFWISQEQEICNTSGNATLKIIFTETTGNTYDYKWDNGDTGKIITVSDHGTYTATVTVNGGCPETRSVYVHPKIDNFKIDITNPSPTCEGDETVLDATVNVPNPTYKWTKGGSYYSNEAIITLSNTTDSGLYKVEITTNSCTYEDVVDITIVSKPDFDIDDDKQLCSGSAIINTTFTPVAGVNYTYFLNGVAKANAPPYTVNSSGDYKIEIIAEGSCSDEEEIHIYGDQFLSITKTNDGVCEGEGSVKLTALLGPDNVTGFKSYVWKNSGGTTVGTGPSITLSDYDESGTYTLHLELNDCPYDASTVVTINPNPTINNISEVDLCGGSANIDVDLDEIIANVKYTYELSGVENQTIANKQNHSNPVTFNVTTAGNYTVTVTTEDGCDDTETFKVNDPVLKINNNATICENDGAVDLNARVYNTAKGANGWTYEWFNSSNTSIGTGRNKSFSTSTESGTYKVVATAPNGCHLEETVDIEIHPDPTFTLTPKVICDGNPVTLEPTALSPADNGSYTYRWTRNGGFFSNSKQISTSTPGTYCLTVRTDNGCPETECVDVIEERLFIDPEPCEPGSLTARVVEYPSGNTTTGHTYHWTTGNYWPAGVDVGSGISISVPNDGLPHTYFLVVTTTNGCTLQDTETITVVPNFDVTLDIDATQCYDFSGGATQVITATGTNIPTDAVYTWSGPGIVSQSGNSITINRGGTYTVVVTLNGVPDQCTDNRASVTISELDNDFCITNDVTNNCDNPPAQCGGSISIGYDLGNGTNYTWTRDGQSIVGNTPFIDASVSGRYRLQATQGDCDYDDFVDVTITQEPTISISKSGDLCSGDVILTADVTNGTGTVIWYKGSRTPANQIGTGLTYTATTDGNYIAYIENAPSCDDEASINITPAQQPIFDNIDDFNICEGESVAIKVEISTTSIPTATWGFDYELYGPNDLTVLVKSKYNDNRKHTFNLNNLTVAEGGTYKIVTYYNGCSYSQEFQVAVNANPAVDLEGDKILCNGGTITLDADPANTYPSATYVWNTTATTRKTTINTPGTYSVVLDNNGCSTSDAITIHQTGDNTNLLGKTAEICDGDTYQLDATINIANATYTWQSTDSAINGSTNPKVLISEAGTYRVTIHDNNTNCDYEEEFILIVNVVDEPGIDNPQTNCTGVGFEITPDNLITGATYKWYRQKSNGSWKKLQDGETFKFESGYSYSWNYKVTVEYNGCTNEKLFNIGKGTQPDFNLNEYKLSCLGYELKIEPFDATNTTYEWYEEGNLLDSTNLSTLHIYGKGGNYSVTATSNIDGCDLTKTIFLDNLYPSNIIVTDTVYLCNNKPETIDFSIPEGKIYYALGFPITEAEAKAYEIRNIGSFDIKIKTNDGCWLYDTIHSKVDILNITMPESRDGCVDDVLQLEAGGDKAEQYEWFVNGVVQNNNKNTFDYIIQEQVDTVVVNAWSVHGCMVADTTVVEPIEMPNIILDDAEICDGESEILNAKPNDPLVNVTGYVWKFDGEIVASGTNASTYEATEEGTYNVIITTTQCSYNEDIVLTVYPTPSFDFGEDITGCLPARPQLEIILDTGITWDIDSYKWYYDEFDDGNLVELPVNGSKYTAIDKGTYYAWVTTLDGCTDSSAIKIDYRLEPTFDLGADISGCTISRPKLEVNITNTDLDQTSDIKTYEWWYKVNTGDDYSLITDSTKSHYFVNIDGIYKAVVETNDGCIYEDSVKVNYQPEPIVNINVPNLNCEQQRPIIYSDIINIDDLNTQGETISYKWYFKGISDASFTSLDSTRANLVIVKDGDYKVEVSTSTCMGEATTNIDYTPKPIVSIESESLKCLASQPIIKTVIKNLTDLNTQGENITYQWYYKTLITDTDSTLLAGETNKDLTVAQDGAYTILVSTDFCSSVATTEIDFSSEPTFDLGADISGCTISRPKLEVNISNTDIDQTLDIKSYEWWHKVNTDDDYTLIADSTEAHYFVNIDGIYKAVVETNDGCIYVDSVKVDYNPEPYVELSAGWDQTVCHTDTVYVSANIENDLSDFEGDLLLIWTVPNVDGSTSIEKDTVFYADIPKLTSEPITKQVHSSGEYTLTIKALNNTSGSCFNNTPASVTVEYKPNPIAKIVLEGTDGICTTADVILKAEIENINDFNLADLTFVWTLPNGNIDKTSGQSLVVTQDGEHKLIIENLNGCDSEEYSHTVDFRPIPEIEIAITGANAVCTDTDVILSAVIKNITELELADLTFMWTLPNGDLDSLSGQNLLVTQDGKHNLYVKTIKGCESNDVNHTVDFRPYPIVTITMEGDDGVCTPNDVVLKADIENIEELNLEDLTFVWTLPNGDIDRTSGPELIVTQDGIHKLVVETVKGCDSNEDSYTVDFRPYPIVAIAIEGNNGICTTADVILKAVIENIEELYLADLTFIWTLPNNDIDSLSGQDLLVTQSGEHKLYIKTVKGCDSNEDVFTIDFRPTPTISVSTEGITGTCTSDPVLLEVKIENPKFEFGDIKYLWTRPGASDTITVAPELLVHENGDYTVRAITEFDCSNQPSKINVDYQPIPKIALNASWTGNVCLTEAGYINVSITNDSDCKEEDITYFWTLPDGITVVETEDPKLEVHASGKYIVQAKSKFECLSEPTEIDIDYTPAPSFTLAGTETCEIDTHILEADFTDMNPDIDISKLTYLWSTGETTSTIEVSNSEDISSAKTVKYSVTITTEGGCTLTKDAFITFNPSPIFDLGDDIEMCDIESRIITIGDIPHDKITWSTGETTKSISVYKAGEYWATVELDGCTYTDVINVETVPFPKFRVEATKMDCDIKVILLEVITEDNNLEFLWNTKNKENTKSIQITKGGDYSVVVRKRGNDATIGCSIVKNIEINNQFFEDYNAIEELTVCEGESLELKPEHEYKSIKWSTGATTPSISVTDAGEYTAVTTNEFFCNSQITYEIELDEGPEITKIEITEGTLNFDHEGGVAPFEYFIDEKEVSSRNVIIDFPGGIHTLYIKDKYGCDCSEEFEFKDDISIIKVVSPNGDGVNDTWKIDALKDRDYNRSHVRIYDRYGRLMHESSGVTLNWDGTFNGKNVPATDYWYHIDLFGDGRTVYTGHFALIR